MKCLIISDIHGNLEALRAIESQIIAADMTICLGDIVGYQCHVNEVLEILQKHNVTCIRGNHDEYLLEGWPTTGKPINNAVKFGIEMADKLITAKNREWLSNLPNSLALKVDHLSMLCCHGSPWDMLNGYVYEDSDLFTKMQELGYDIIALGHTHRQYLKKGKTTILNPGSVGQARDMEGIVCAKILDTQTAQVQNINLAYDYQKEINHSLSCGAQDWIYKHYKSLLPI